MDEIVKKEVGILEFALCQRGLIWVKAIPSWVLTTYFHDESIFGRD